MSGTNRGQLVVLCLTVGMAMSTYFMVAPLVPLYGLSIGMSPALIGLFVSLTFVAPLFLAIPIGTLVDRRGVRPFMFAGIALFGTLPLMTAFWPGPTMIGVMQVGMGVAQILLILCGQSVAASYASGEERLRHFGWFTTSVSAGQLAGPLVAGVAADQFGYPFSFGIAGAIALTSLGGLFFLRSGSPQQSTPLGTPMFIRQISSFWEKPNIRIAMFASSSVLLAIAVNQAFLPVLLGESSFSATGIGLLFSIQAFAGMLIRPFVSSVSGLFGRRSNALLVVSLLVMLGMLTIGVQQASALVVLAVVALGVGAGVSQPLSMIMVLDEVGEAERGMALGFRISGNRLAQLLGPIAMGIVASRYGVGSAFVLTALCLVALLVITQVLYAKGSPATTR